MPSSLRQPLHSFVGDVGSSSSIPSFISSPGFGRCCSFCSKLSARICFCSSLCWPCKAGAAVESGRMLPNKSPQCQSLGRYFWVGGGDSIGQASRKYSCGAYPYVQSAPPSPAASPALSSSYRWPVGARVPTGWTVSLCFPR